MTAVEPTKTEDLIRPHVSASKKAFEEREKEIATEREAMIKRNTENMEALAREVPSPTPDEIRRALAGRAYKEETDVVEKTEPSPKKDDDDANKPDVTNKTSTASTDQQGGKYNTRDMRANSNKK